MIKKQILTEEDYNQLSAFYLTNTYISIRKYIETKVNNAAQIALADVSSMEELAWQKGYAKGLLELQRLIENSSKEVDKIHRRQDAEEAKKDNRNK